MRAKELRYFENAIPGICFGTERKVRKALLPYEGEEFTVARDFSKVIPGLRRHGVARLYRVYSHCATFEITVGQNGLFRGVSKIYYSIPLYEVGKAYTPRHEKPGFPWLRYDGEKRVYAEEE